MRWLERLSPFFRPPSLAQGSWVCLVFAAQPALGVDLKGARPQIIAAVSPAICPHTYEESTWLALKKSKHYRWRPLHLY